MGTQNSTLEQELVIQASYIDPITIKTRLAVRSFDLGKQLPFRTCIATHWHIGLGSGGM